MTQPLITGTQLSPTATLGRFLDMQIFGGPSTPATWTKPAGTNVVEIWAVASGGAGGGTTNSTGTTQLGGGGAAGGALYTVIDSGLGATETIIFGAPGAGVTGGNGTDAGDTTFGAHFTCFGGAGGAIATVASTQAIGGNSSGGGTFVYRIAGQTGAPNISFANTTFPREKQSGGEPGFGMGNAHYQNFILPGNSENGFSSGHGGGYGGPGAISINDSTSRQGGPGGWGIMIVKSYS